MGTPRPTAAIAKPIIKKKDNSKVAPTNANTKANPVTAPIPATAPAPAPVAAPAPAIPAENPTS